MSVNRGELCPTCGRFNSRHLVIDGVVINQKNEVLLVKRGIEPGYGKWALPGGYLDWDESLEEGVIREVKEETGIETKIERMLNFYDSPTRNYQNIAITFLLRPISDTPFSFQAEEILDGGWFSFDKLPEDIAFDHNIMLDDYQKLQ